MRRGGPNSSSSMPPNKRRRKQRGLTVPPLPSAVADENIKVSDEDVKFVRNHKEYAEFFAHLGAESIARQVLGLKADEDGDDLETQYEKSAMRQINADAQFSIDPVDALPVRTLVGELRYQSRSTLAPVDGSSLNLEERRAFVRKGKNGVAKKTLNEGLDEEEKKKNEFECRKAEKQLKRKAEQSKQKDIPSEEDIPSEKQSVSCTAEDDSEREPNFKARMAEIAVDLLADPNGNIMTLQELQEMCIDRDEGVAQFAMLSSMAIFKDLIPGYRIRPRTEKEREGLVSKEVRSLWDYETALLRYYQAYVKLLVKSAKLRSMRWSALRCLCGLLEAVPHFNYRESIVSAVIPRMGSGDKDCSKMCCDAIKGLFLNPGKHGHEATLEAVQLIADFVRLRNCQLPPEVIQVFFVLSFDDDLLRDSTSRTGTLSSMDEQKRAPPKLSTREEKKVKKTKKREIAAQLRKEVEADFREASVLPSLEACRKFQTLTLTSLFETYFRILKTSLEPEKAPKPDGTIEPSKGRFRLSRPLLKPCLEGLAKLSHLISVDFMADLLRVLQGLAEGGKSSSEGTVGVWKRLQCCTIAFEIVRINMDALTVDLRDFFTLFYNLLLEAVSNRDGDHSPETLAQALQIMLWDGTHNDMSRVAAFVKRLATISLHLRSGEGVAVLATAQQLLVRYKKCRIIVENNPGSGPGSSHLVVLSSDEDPDLSEALSTVLWELTLLARHYSTEIAKYVATIASMNKSTSIVMPSITPLAAVKKNLFSA